jgi:hypothetical protein
MEKQCQEIQKSDFLTLINFDKNLNCKTNWKQFWKVFKNNDRFFSGNFALDRAGVFRVRGLEIELQKKANWTNNPRPFWPLKRPIFRAPNSPKNQKPQPSPNLHSIAKIASLNQTIKDSTGCRKIICHFLPLLILSCWQSSKRKWLFCWLNDWF